MTPFIEPIDWDWNMDQMEAYEYQRDAEIIEGDMVLCDGVWYVVDEIEWDMMLDSNNGIVCAIVQMKMVQMSCLLKV